VFADDVEIYLTEPPDPVPPNVLFVLDESGSMSSGDPSRRDRLEEAMRTLINDDEMGNVNAALLGYTTNWGENGPLWLRAHSGNFSIIEDNRTTMLNAVDNLGTRSYTPTVKAMEAAVNWFRRDRTFTDTNNFTTTSPIAGTAQDNWCRPNHMVVLTDGRPNSNSPSRGQAYGLTSYEGTNCTSDATSNYQNGRCAREIAAWAYNTDLETSADWIETQNIVTHTIGFDSDSDTHIRNFMVSIANAGGGNYYPASSVSDLVGAFTSIVTEAMESIPYAYTAPVIPFNQDNAAVSGNRIYVPLLVPGSETFWKGNLKKYTIRTEMSGTDEVSVVLEDADGNSIINDAFEFVDSRDHWASSSDGGEPLVGGAASHMQSSGSRNIYSNLNGDTTVPLSDSTNRVHRDNALITNDMLNVATDTARTEVLNWISWDSDSSHEGEMGAPLHSQPGIVNYSDGDVVYLPTSEGVLEAFDAETGEELWAFMPSDLLDEILIIKNNNDATTPHYGLDGPLTIYETGVRTMAIVGMRRGGYSYYLLDITDKLAPLFVAQISDPDPSSTGSEYDTLGQTWSKPLLARMNVSGTTTDVLVFGGGYDPDQDDATSRSDDDQGTGIYIIQASDGAFINRISNDTTGVSDMNNSIPSDVLPFDMNRNGIMDRIYAADVGGRVIRIDIPEDSSSSLQGAIIADVNLPTSGTYRRFFNTPEVGYYNRGGVQYLAILIGSGNRASPLDQSVTDRFYMIKDTNVWAAPSTYVTIVQSDLYDATDNLVQDGSDAQQLQAQSDLAGAQGWYIDFDTGEKSFSEAVLYNYAVMFTTYNAERSSELAACEARSATGTSRFYTVNMIDASAMFSGLGGNEGTLDINDRTKFLNMAGLPPTPTLLFPDNQTDESGGGNILGSVVTALVALENVNDWPLQLIPIWWEEVIND
jgi:type IV pilus assembly protein PilY1